MKVDAVLGRQAFNDALELAASWLSEEKTRALTNETPLQFITRQVTEDDEFKDDREIFRLFCSNSQNRGGAQHIFNWDVLGETVLKGYNYKEILKEYPATDEGLVAFCKAVLEAAEGDKGDSKKYIIKGKRGTHLGRLKDPLNNKQGAWIKFLETVQNGAVLFENLSKDKSKNNLKDALMGPLTNEYPVEDITEDDLNKAIAPFIKLPNIGYALAANFLKDLGSRHFFKPDTHTLKVVKGAFGAASVRCGNKGEQKAAVRKVLAFSKATGIPMAYIDRVMWFSGSGTLLGPKKSDGQGGVLGRLPDEDSQDRIAAMSKTFRKAVIQL